MRAMERWLERGGARLSWEESGIGEPVVLLHGAFANRGHFARQVDRLSLTRHVIAVDFRGHGASSAPQGGYSIAELAEDVAAVLSEAQAPRAAVVGHSLGGAVALELARLDPDLVAALVLLDGAVLYPRPLCESLLTKLVPALEGDAWAATAQSFLRSSFATGDPPELRERVMAEIAATPAHVAAPMIRDLLLYDAAPALSSINVPVLYVHAIVPTDLGRLRELRPNASVTEMMGVGHYFTLSAPDRTNEILVGFLGSLITSSRN